MNQIILHKSHFLLMLICLFLIYIDQWTFVCQYKAKRDFLDALWHFQRGKFILFSILSMTEFQKESYKPSTSEISGLEWGRQYFWVISCFPWSILWNGACIILKMKLGPSIHSIQLGSWILKLVIKSWHLSQRVRIAGFQKNLKAL